MTDLTYTLRGDVRRASVATLGSGEAGNVKKVAVSKSVTTRADGDTLKLLRLPSNARIHGDSLVSWDDLETTTTSSTMDVGIGSVDSNTTSDPDALLAGLAISAAGTSKLVSDHANYGKKLWEIAGLASDPGGELDIYASFVDAVTNATGDVTLEVEYTLD